MRYAPALFAVLFSAACQEEPPTASGSFRRPGGLAIAERPASPDRADLFIADSERQGVRVLQLQSSGGEHRKRFVEAPAVFFPLGISAPGFPTELALSKDEERLFVLAPAAGLLHVLEVKEVPFRARAADGSNVSLGALGLDALAPGLVTVDVAVAAEIEGDDLVLVLFDSLGDAPGVLLAARVRSSEAGVAVVEGSTETATVGAGPRDLLVVEGGLALVSSAATSSITEVRLDLGAAPGRVLGASRRLGAGGPTDRLVDAKEVGVLALRLDRAAAAFFEREGTGRFSRSTSRIASPYTPPEERGTEAQRGRVDLRGSLARSGAYGNVGALGFAGATDAGVVPLLGPDDMGHVVLLAHLDGRASFLVGSPPRPALVSSAKVVSIQALGGEVSVAECEGPAPVCGAELPPTCDPAMIAIDFPAARTYRAEYQGTIARGRSADLSLGPASTSTRATLFTLTDGSGIDFGRRLVREGDRALVQLRAPRVCPAPGEATEPVDLVDTGTVTEVLGARLTLAFAGDLRTHLPCADGAGTRRSSVAVYEVFPGGEEAVLTRVSGASVDEVLERAPVLNGADGQVTSFDVELRFTLRGVGAFECDLDGGQGALCASAADCGSGRRCSDPAASEGGTCPARCDPACSDLATGCLEVERVRTCSGAEIAVDPTVVAALDLRGEAALASVPESTIFSVLRGGWFTSYPGSRGVMEVRAGESGSTIEPTR